MNTIVLATQQYEKLPASVAVKPQNKIEVVELFSYGCGHCFNFEKSLDPWIKNLPTDVDFNRVPAMFGGLWDVQGRMFLTLQVMAVDYSVHHAVFEAVRKRQRLTNAEEMAEFLATVGVDRDSFIATYHSFAVQAKVMDAKKKTKAYEVSGVPTMVVNGKYRLDLGVGSAQLMLQQVEQLVDKERSLH